MQRVGADGYFAAGTALRAFLRDGKSSGRAPRWATTSGEGYGRSFVTNAETPGICVVVREGVAITVLTRSIAAAIHVYEAEALCVQRRRAMA
jgi:hypothetical protein